MFRGQCYLGNGCSYYWLSHNGAGIPLCPSNLFHECGVSFLPEDFHNMTWDHKNKALEVLSYGWGYEGHGPELLAITLLGLYAARPYMGPSMSHVSSGCRPRPMHNDPGIVVKHFKAFTTEVIANLPDNWTMTMEDIDKWVKEKESNDKNNKEQ